MQWLCDLFSFWFKIFLDASNIALAIILWADGLVTVTAAVVLSHKGLVLWWGDTKEGGLSKQDWIMKRSFYVGMTVFVILFCIVNPFLRYQQKASEATQAQRGVIHISNELRITKSDLAESEKARLKLIENTALGAPSNLVHSVQDIVREYTRLFVDSQTNSEANIAILKKIASSPAKRLPDGKTLSVVAAEDVLKDMHLKAAAREALARTESDPPAMKVLTNWLPTVQYCRSTIEKEGRNQASKYDDYVISNYTNALQLLGPSELEAVINMASNSDWQIHIAFRKHGASYHWEMFHDPFDFLCTMSEQGYSYNLVRNGGQSYATGTGTEINPTNFNSALAMLMALENAEHPFKSKSQ